MNANDVKIGVVYGTDLADASCEVYITGTSCRYKGRAPIKGRETSFNAEIIATGEALIIRAKDIVYERLL